MNVILVEKNMTKNQLYLQKHYKGNFRALDL